MLTIEETLQYIPSSFWNVLWQHCENLPFWRGYVRWRRGVVDKKLYFQLDIYIFLIDRIKWLNKQDCLWRACWKVLGQTKSLLKIIMFGHLVRFGEVCYTQNFQHYYATFCIVFSRKIFQLELVNCKRSFLYLLRKL